MAVIKSIYRDYLERLMPSFTELREEVNKDKTPRVYLHKQMLRRVHSTDKHWVSAGVHNRYVAADTVAMDSPLPIKSRPAIEHATGKLPKVGLMRQMKESDIDAVDRLIERHAELREILAQLYNDVDFCSVGIDEKNEYAFLYALSRGYVLVEDMDNVGVGIRVNFGYLEHNTFGVVNEGHISREDIERLLSQADHDGNTPGYISLSSATYRKLRGERWARELVASYNDQTYTEQTSLPVPGSKAFDAAFADEFNGIKFNVIDRKVDFEKNGKVISLKPFANDVLIFHTTMKVGALVWSDLVEKNHQVEGVLYQLIDEFKLISSYGETNPLRMFTAGQALVLPVIENVDEIYMLDGTLHQPLDEADSTSEGGVDSVITAFGNRYDKSDVVAIANKMFNLGLSLAKTDAEVIEAINTLSQSKQGKLKKALEAESVYYPVVGNATLDFVAAGESKTTTVKTNASGDITATASESWVTASVENGVLTVTAAANSGAARTAKVTVTAGEKSAEIAISQAAQE